jgi:hypothetical protein
MLWSETRRVVTPGNQAVAQRPHTMTVPDAAPAVRQALRPCHKSFAPRPVSRLKQTRLASTPVHIGVINDDARLLAGGIRRL